jgi:pantothenate kinase
MAMNAPDPVHLEMIRDLENRAATLKTLLDSRSAKRPLIIEFSGSPKAGKTRCISVLELFLKRNGIKVEVLYRAGFHLSDQGQRAPQL